jgi:hypothetical protein
MVSGSVADAASLCANIPFAQSYKAIMSKVLLTMFLFVDFVYFRLIYFHGVRCSPNKRDNVFKRPPACFAG